MGCRGSEKGARLRFAWLGLVALLPLTWLAGQTACYRVASHNRLDRAISTLAITPFENATTAFRAEQIMTRALARGFVEKTRFELVEDPAQADAVLSGSIDRVSANAVVFGRGSFGNTFLVTLTASVEMRDKAGQVLYRNDRFIFREQYVLNQDVDNFFSEVNPALERIAHDFASSVVASILEDF